MHHVIAAAECPTGLFNVAGGGVLVGTPQGAGVHVIGTN